jgi:hypothetical protein
MNKSSNLYYHGTQDEVRLGDLIEVKGWFRTKRATVVYIPGQSPILRNLEYSDVKHWAIRDENGTINIIAYDPEHFQPPRKFRLLGRGSEVNLSPDELFE